MLIKGRWLTAAFVMAQGFFAAAPAKAWVCARAQDNNGVSTGPANGWSQTRQLSYAFNSQGTAQLPVDQTFAALRASFQVWAYSQLRSDQADPTCALFTAPGSATSTDVSFNELPATNANNVGYNFLDPNSNVNLIVFRDEAWPHDTDVSVSTGDIIALTTTTYNQLTGQIFDADIEFNSASFAFTLGDSGVSTDLMNTATHEVGHFLGFAHSSDSNATMFYSAQTGETVKRFISCDDAAILWFRYPAGNPNQGMCDPNMVTSKCGLCAPPTPLKFDPSVSVLGTNNGRSRASSCEAVSPVTWLGLALALTGWFRIRRALRRRVRDAAAESRDGPRHSSSRLPHRDV